MKRLFQEIRNCTVCEKFLPEGVNPVFQAHQNSKIAIVGQAPGRIVHQTGIPFDDKSGDNLRAWLGVDKATFYNPQHFAIIPMGFCYPGTGKSGDLPPRPECAPLWHEKLFHDLKELKLILLVGNYAQAYYLGKNQKKTLTETVAHFKDYLPRFFPLPHPSPRNNIWQSKNPWFKREVLEELKLQVEMALQ